LEEYQSLLEKRTRLGIVILRMSNTSQLLERKRYACFVSQLPIQCQTLSTECLGLVTIVLSASERASTSKGFRSHRYRNLGNRQASRLEPLPSQHSFQPVAPFTQVTTYRPEPPECSCQM